VISSCAFAQQRLLHQVIYEGIRAAADKYGVAVAGGDTVRSEIVVVTSRCSANRRAAARSAQRRASGDTIFVTETCGDSRAGFEVFDSGITSRQKRIEPYMKRLTERHLAPEPSVDAGLAASASGASQR